MLQISFNFLFIYLFCLKKERITLKPLKVLHNKNQSYRLKFTRGNMVVNRPSVNIRIQVSQYLTGTGIRKTKIAGGLALSEIRVGSSSFLSNPLLLFKRQNQATREEIKRYLAIIFSAYCMWMLCKMSTTQEKMQS